MRLRRCQGKLIPGLWVLWLPGTGKLAGQEEHGSAQQGGGGERGAPLAHQRGLSSLQRLRRRSRKPLCQRLAVRLTWRRQGMVGDVRPWRSSGCRLRLPPQSLLRLPPPPHVCLLPPTAVHPLPLPMASLPLPTCLPPSLRSSPPPNPPTVPGLRLCVPTASKSQGTDRLDLDAGASALAKPVDAQVHFCPLQGAAQACEKTEGDKGDDGGGRWGSPRPEPLAA